MGKRDGATVFLLAGVTESSLWHKELGLCMCSSLCSPVNPVHTGGPGNKQGTSEIHGDGATEIPETMVGFAVSRGNFSTKTSKRFPVVTFLTLKI